MKKWRVRIARDTTESMDMEIEASSASEANDKAMAEAGRYGERVSNWGADDCGNGEVYLPDSASTIPVGGKPVFTDKRRYLPQ